MIRFALALTGLLLLAVVLWQAELPAVWRTIVQVGWYGVLAVIAVHLLSFLADVMLWMLAYDEVALTPRWCVRFYVVRLIGEAFNNATPLASMGGEPVKAHLLKERYGIGYDESALAFLVAKTANLIALVVFLAVGFAVMLGDPRFPRAYQTLAATGLAVLALAIVVLFGVQQTRVASRFGARLARRREAWTVHGALAAVEAFEERLITLYRRSPRRFGQICGLALLTWLAGIFEIWIILAAAGHPISLVDAWLIEAVVQLIRTAAFFIPGGLGVIEVGFLVVVTAVTGSETLGVVVAIVRRFRDLVWIAAGMLLALARGERELLHRTEPTADR